ncbi:MAG: two-component sensor histidine kinase [Deltaproteobacteria bacterium]|nr:two-component sensor histidine kinase [Deltaproteobacteria bacterium]MBW2051695.1 two-component sensor histidine kinase [Deltaproteobacteria bacterium]MBW2139977.1 two-component sensor histidine kinase [Deltaproteobacteria bacterium]MBW2322315.1 two-component sensor histidine kinase [Deltaproteobacteria bacterium]
MTRKKDKPEPDTEQRASLNLAVEGGEDSAEPKRLVRYFSFTGFFAIIVFTLFLSLFISQQAKNMLLSDNEDYANLVAKYLNRQVSQKFINVILSYGYTSVRLREKFQFELMDRLVRRSIHGFKIDHVNIYDFDGMIIYSTNPNLIETTGQDSEAYKEALEGKSTSTLVTNQGRFGGFGQTRILQTFSPIRRELFDGSEGYVMGVFEIHQDLTDDYAEIVNFQYISILVSLLVMSLLFLVLRQIVKRADKIIEERNAERRRFQEKLHQSERLANLGQMIAAVSHEVRNPLGIISSTAEILRGKLKQYEPDNQLADVIVEESRRLNEIVTEFLDFARPKVPKIATTSLKDVLDKNLYYLSSELEKFGIKVIRRYGGPALIEADPDQLYQAFLNIFLNAIQAMPDGGVINVRTTGVNGRHSNMAEVVISDTGQGIKPETLDKIFNPFFTTKDQGSGLGLSIVKNIITNHKGEIFIEPLHGEGARVIIHLPVKQD